MMKKRKRRSDRNQVIYYIRNTVTNDLYIGLTAVCYAGNIKRTLIRRMQKHMQRAQTENKNWGLSRALRQCQATDFVFGPLEVVRGKKAAHARETELIKQYNPSLNTFK